MTASAGFLGQVTPVILTYNEAPNINRSLERLRPFAEVVIVDSGSIDGTLAMVAEFSNTRVIHRPFDSFSGQWNHVLRAGGLKTEWVLAMDADYLLTDALIDELSRLEPSRETMAYRIGFDYWVLGKKLSATLYPPIIVLYRHRETRYVQDGHAMRALVSGEVKTVKNRIQHDDRKPFSRWLASQARYAEEECELLLSKSLSDLSIQDRLRRMIVIAPWLVPMYCLIVGRGALDGWAGFYYALQRGIAEALLALKLIEAQIERRKR